MNIKNIFRITTVIITAISLIGCSSAPKKDIPVYKQEMDEPLQVGVNYKFFEDYSSLTINVNEDNQITSILKASKEYDDRTICLKYLELESDVLLDKLGPFYGKDFETKSYLANDNYSISKKQCESMSQSTKITTKYQYTIEVRPISKSAQNNMIGVVEMFKAIGLWLFGVVVIAPIMIVGFVVIGIPLVIYWMIIGKKDFANG